MTGPFRKSGYVTCRPAVRVDDDLVIDIQIYLKLHCRQRAFIEIDDAGMAVHFQQASEAAAFAEAWAAWLARGLGPPSDDSSGIDNLAEGDRDMALRAKIVLRPNLSSQTIESIRTYLGDFLARRHSLEHFDGRLSIYLHDPNDIRLLRERFASLIVSEQSLP